jgi:raffinose/stachyose/melibiose transport system substrate-binding protein
MFRLRQSLPVVLVALLMLAGLGARLARAQDEQIELRVWDQFTGANSEAIQAIYDSFTEANPNITIEREVIDSDTMRDTINTAISSGTGPDIFNYDAGPGYAGVLADAGLLAPLDGVLDAAEMRSRIAPYALAGTTIDGTTFGLPTTVDLIGVYANNTLIAEAGLTVPQTLAELVTFCGAASEAGYVPLALSANPGWETFHQFSMVVNAILGPAGVGQLLIENQGSWNTPEVISAIDAYFVQLRDAGCFSDDVTALTYDDAAALFYSGQSLMWPTGSWQIANVESNMPDADIGFMQFPQIDGALCRCWVSGVGSAYFVSAQSEQQEAAMALLQYLYSDEIVLRWVNEANIFMPVQLDLAQVQVSPLSTSILETLQSGIAGETEFGYNVDVLAPPAFNDMMMNGFPAILNGDKTPEEQAADLQAAWEEGMGTPVP